MDNIFSALTITVNIFRLLIFCIFSCQDSEAEAKDSVQQVLQMTEQRRHAWEKAWEEQRAKLEQNLQVCQFYFDLKQVRRHVICHVICHLICHVISHVICHVICHVTCHVIRQVIRHVIRHVICHVIRHVICHVIRDVICHVICHVIWLY